MSQLVLKINGAINQGEALRFEFTINDIDYVEMSYTFQTVRTTAATPTTIGNIAFSTDPAGQPQNSANGTNIVNAINADKSGFPLAFFTASGGGFIDGNDTFTVVIQSNSTGQIRFRESPVPTLPANVSYTINNDNFSNPFSITDVAFSQADTAPCSNVKVTFTEENGVPPYTWISPLPGNTGLSGDLPRTGSDQTITIQDSASEVTQITIFVPATISAGTITSITSETNPSENDAAVTVFTEALQGLEYEYAISLVGGSYSSTQVSNVFPNVEAGNYTFYIIDKDTSGNILGCSAQQNFEVVLDVVIPPAVFQMRTTQSHQWYDITNSYDGVSTFYDPDLSDPNSLNINRIENPHYCQPWATVDSTTTQIDTNYSSRIFEGKDKDGNVIDTYTPTKITDNLGFTDRRDCVIYDRGANQTGIIFNGGNIYDPVTQLPDGQSSLFGQLPEYGRVGQRIELINTDADGFFEVKQTIFDVDKNALALVIDRSYVEPEASRDCIIEAIYDRLPYETYEVVAGMQEDLCYIDMNITDPNYPTQPIAKRTTTLKVSEKPEDTVYLAATRKPTDGVDYSNGIIFKQRFEALFDMPLPESEKNDYQDSKNQSILLDSVDKRIWTLKIADCPFWVAEKISLLLNKEEIVINGRKLSVVDIPEPERTQQYLRVIDWTIILMEKNYESIIPTGWTFTNTDESLLETDTGLLRIN